MTPIKRTLLYIFRGDLLRLRVSWPKGNSVTFSVGYHVDRDKWTGERCRRNTTHGPHSVAASTINAAIEALERRIDEAFLIFEREDRNPDKAELKAAVDPSKNAKAEPSFFEVYEEYIRDGEANSYWYPITVRMNRVRMGHLKEFRPSLTFRTLTADTLRDFVAFMTSRKVVKVRKDPADPSKRITEKTNYNNSYVLQTLKWVQAFLRWATRKGYYNNPEAISFRPSLKKAERTVVFLDWEELMRVYGHDYSANPRLDAVRDCFCFCCFTSLRYSDMANLKKANIGADSFTITTLKTTDKITIELNKYSRAILEKYADNGSPFALPSISQQKMNDYLKEIARDCGLDAPVQSTVMSGNRRRDVTRPKHEVISTHCGRRTFICNALALGIPPTTVMEWTGHSDYKAMEPYIAVADRMRRDSMKLFDNL